MNMDYLKMVIPQIPWWAWVLMAGLVYCVYKLFHYWLFEEQDSGGGDSDYFGY